MSGIKLVGIGVKISSVYANVTYIPLENTLNTKVKQIRNPQKDISGGFLF